MKAINNIKSESLVMKIVSLFFYCTLFSSLLFFSSCGSDPSPTPAELMTKKLTANEWKIKTVSVAGTDQTIAYKNMSLVFSATGFTSSNGGVVWPSSGTWKFTDDNATSIKRGDDVVVSLTEVTATSLIITLTWAQNTFGPGRNSSLAGVHVFTMSN